MKNWRTWLLIAVGLVGLSCAKDNKADADAAVRKAIEEHLAGRPGLSSSDIVMELKNVQIQGEKAEAEVLFRSRTDANATMNFHYQLHKEGRTWKVEETRPNAGGSPHGTPALPHDGTPSEPEPSGSAGPLPEGHPPLGNREQGTGNR